MFCLKSLDKAKLNLIMKMMSKIYNKKIQRTQKAAPLILTLDEALWAEIEGESYFYPRGNIVPDSPDKSGSSNK